MPRTTRSVPYALRRSLSPSTADPLPVSEAVTTAWATIVSDCRRAGIHRTVKLVDALIAATAVEHGLSVLTQDSDYDQIARAHPALQVYKV